MGLPRWWSPAGADSRGRGLPEPGQLIAYMNRKAWRVLDVEDRDPANWDEQTLEAWRKAGEPDPTTWDGRERVILAEPARGASPGGKDRRGLRLYPWAHDTQWWPLPDPYPACVECGLLWPCPCNDRNVAAAEAMQELDRLGKIMPGCCWACNEPVSSRHHSVVFDGENLLLPGAGPAVFHTAYARKASQHSWGDRTCRQAAQDYEKRWVEAAPGRHPRLSCPGSMWRHPDYAECTAGDSCPGDQATHRDFHHCHTAFWTHVGTTAIKLEPVTNCGRPDCHGPALPAADQIQAEDGHHA